ncbi:MAG: MAPEG family protein [Rhodocyclaceae bacterium]
MNISFLCVLIASVMPFALTVLAKAGGGGRRFDNRRPREYLQQLSGWRQRANWAQQNAFETLPIFIGGVLMASLAQVPQQTVDIWAIVFVVARVAYNICYLADLAPLRSLMWAVATLAAVRLMAAAL